VHRDNVVRGAGYHSGVHNPRALVECGRCGCCAQASSQQELHASCVPSQPPVRSLMLCDLPHGRGTCRRVASQDSGNQPAAQHQQRKSRCNVPARVPARFHSCACYRPLLHAAYSLMVCGCCDADAQELTSANAPLRLTQDLLDPVVVARLIEEPPENYPLAPFHYLLSCYARASEELRALGHIRDAAAQQAVQAAVLACRDLAVSYCCLTLTAGFIPEVSCLWPHVPFPHGAKMPTRSNSLTCQPHVPPLLRLAC
jgi:hypothetical protein